MGKFSGKILTLYITSTGVRVCEGENRNGDPDISRFFTVYGVSDFFSSKNSGHSVEIINMSGLVNAIVTECINQRTTAKKILISSGCFGITTEIDTSDNSNSWRDVLTRDLKSVGKTVNTKSRPKSIPGKVISHVNWGGIIQDGVALKYSTTTTGDKYMLKSLAQEFSNHGYEIVLVSDLVGSLMNFRYTEEATFDSKGKVIINLDENCTILTLSQDVPRAIEIYDELEGGDIIDRVVSTINNAIEFTGRNPKIYLSGSKFQDTRLYGELIDVLVIGEGLSVYDLFGRPQTDENYTVKLMAGEVKPVLTPDYAVNIALLLVPFAKQTISLEPGLDAGDIFKKNSKATTLMLLLMTVGIFAFSAFVAGTRLIQNMDMKDNPSRLGELQNQISQLNNRQHSLNSTIQTLTQADITILELLRFVNSNQSSQVNVISIDTRDLLTSELAVEGTNNLTVSDGDTDSLFERDTSASRAAVVVRGYAKSGSAAVSYFDRMFNLGLPYDPVLNGVEKYTLPDGNEVYVFEIEIRGDELE